MEHKQFTSDDLGISQCSNEGFQADRFTKKTNQLNIPDTILENCSAELSGDSLKMEVPKIVTEYFNNDDKENINCNQQIMNNESLSNSTNFEIDISYIKDCEKKLLEISNTDDRCNEFENKNLVNSQLLKVSGNLNNTISTPPSLLRREINMLRTEMAETHEFHDLEMKLLREEKNLQEMDSENNAEILEKYSTLMELYTALKTSYDEYRRAQEKMGRELQSKTADCLESLCSQIEASDNSFNISTASFVSFSGGIRSSTMMEDISEVEATVLHEATVLANDPLSITNGFKTPTQTPLRSIKELFPPNSTASKPIKEVKEIVANTTTPLDSEHNIQLLNLETALYDKINEVKDLEQRLFKVEDMSSALQNEFERISSVYATENNNLKESLSEKTEQLNELTQKLFTETISLNPSLKDSLIDVSGRKLLLVFMETIMENCKKIKGDVAPAAVEDLQNQLATQEIKLMELDDLKKTCESLERKLSNAENTVLTRDEEIRMLQSHLGNVRQTREDLASAKEALSELESRLTLQEAEKKAAENRCVELETVIKNLNSDIDAKEQLRVELQTRLSTAEKQKSEMTNESSRLKEMYDALQVQMVETEKLLQSNESVMSSIKESLSSAEESIQDLKSQLSVIQEEKAGLQMQCCELQDTNQKLQLEINEVKNSEDKEEVQTENEELKQKILESEKMLAELRTELEGAKASGENNSCKIEELMKEIELLNSEKSGFTKELESMEKNLADVLANVGGDLPSERIHKLFENIAAADTQNSEIMTAITDTIAKTCKGIQNELIKKFESEKHEWESQKDIDSNTIKSLKDEINTLIEKSTEYEAKISDINLEKEELVKLHENLKNQVTEAEKVISSCNDVIKSREDELKQTKDDLAATEEVIEQLKSQLSSLETDKVEIQLRCQELEEVRLNLQTEINAKEEIMKDMEEFKAARQTAENENGDLKQKIQELGEEIDRLKKSLEAAEEEQMARELKMKDSQNEIEQLMKEKEGLTDLTEKLEKLEKNNKNLMDVISAVQTHLDVSEDSLSQILSGDLDVSQMFTERINNLIQNRMDDLKAEWGVGDFEMKQIELEELKKTCCDLQTKLSESEQRICTLQTKQTELEELRIVCGSLETKLTEAENTNSALATKQMELEELKNTCHNLETKLLEAMSTISEREEEVRNLQICVNQTQEDLAATKAHLSELESRLASTETQKADAENQCQELEKTIENLNREAVEKENIRSELESRKSDAENQCRVLEETIENLNREAVEKENIRSGLEAQKTDAENRCRELEEITEKLKLDIDTNEKARTDLETQLSLAEEKKTELENECVQLKETCDAVKAQLVETETAVAQRDEEIRILKSNETSLENNLLELIELKKSCLNLESKLSEANCTISAREEEIQKLQSDVAQAQEDLVSANKTKETELEELRNACSNLEVKLSEVEKTNAALEMKQIELEKLKEASSNLETELSEAEGKMSELQEKLLKAGKTISEQEEEIRIFHLHITEAQEDLAGAKTTLTDLESQLASAETQKAEAENRCRDLEQTIETLNQKIIQKESLQSEFENQKLKFESENLRLKESFDALKLQMTETENVIFSRDEEIRELKTYECQLASVKESLACADETILKLKSQLKSAESEKSEMETRCTELEENNQNLRIEVNTAKNLENNPVYEKIQIENGDLKERILESEKMMSELKDELEIAKRDQMNNICKVEDLIREIEELKRENDGFSCALSTIEETQKNLADVLSLSANDSDLPSDRITKLIVKTLPDSAETRETKIVSDFVETITKTCKGVQNELIRKFDNKKLEWETQKDFDIQNLVDQIKLLNEKNNENEVALKQTKHELSEADEAILKLKSQLSSTEVEKVEIELQVRKLEENVVTLQSEIDTKETIIKGLDELKIVRQKIEIENGDLKQQLLESEEVIVRLKKSLDIAREEQVERELKMKDSQKEVELLKKEKEGLMDLADKLEKLEKNNKNLMDVFSEVQTQLDIPENVLRKILSGEAETNKIVSERINNLIKGQTEGLKSENKYLKLGNDNLKEKIKQLTKLIGETANEAKEELANLNMSLSNSMSLRSKPSRKSDMCARRLDKLEEINHNLTELVTKMLTMTEFPDPDKLKLYSVRDFPNVMKKVVAHMNSLDEKMKEVKEENAQLDEECETYAKIIKDLKKEAATVWKTNKEKTEEMEAEINRLKEEKNGLVNEKQELLTKISKLDADCQKLKSSKSEGAPHICVCGNESKKINELKRTILVKEQKLLELQDLEAQTSSYKAQIEYLKNALEREKKKIGEEKEKNKKLQDELKEATKNQKTEEKKTDENQMLDELRMRGSLSGGIVQEFVDKEKMRKLSKDIGILKELCRARYAEIKRLEAVNAALRNNTPKNSNQMDSPIRTRGYNTRSKVQPRDLWKPELAGKENSAA